MAKARNAAAVRQQLQMEVDAIAGRPSADFTQAPMVHRPAPQIEPAPIEFAEAEDDEPQEPFGRWPLAWPIGFGRLRIS